MECEEVHLVQRLKPNPPKPSSFYTSPERTLPWSTYHNLAALPVTPPPSLPSPPCLPTCKQSYTPMCVNYRQAFNFLSHVDPFCEGWRYSGQKKNWLRKKSSCWIAAHWTAATESRLIRAAPSFREKKGRLVFVPASVHQTATWIRLLWRTKEPRYRGGS